jgi:hypothetical protein
MGTWVGEDKAPILRAGVAVLMFVLGEAVVRAASTQRDVHHIQTGARARFMREAEQRDLKQ